MNVFSDEKVITACMVISFGCSLLMRLTLAFLYSHLIKEADNMASTKNKLLKQCKIKFVNCYELNNGVANVSVYADKFINRLSLGAVSFRTLYHLSGQLMLLSVVCSGIGVCRSIIKGKSLIAILPFYIASFAGLYAFFSLSTLIDLRGKKTLLKVNLVDYLENHLSPRMQDTGSNLEMLYGEASHRGAAARRRKQLDVMPISNRACNASVEKVDQEISFGEMPEKVSGEELEELLKEFLTV